MPTQGMRRRQSRLMRGAVYVGSGSIQARLYDFGAYPGAIQSLKKCDRVFGDVYRVPDDRILARLDRYEACCPIDPLPHEYAREKVLIQLSRGQSLLAWAYWYTQPLRQVKLIKGGDYLRYLDKKQT